MERLDKPTGSEKGEHDRLTKNKLTIYLYMINVLCGRLTLKLFKEI